MSTSLLPNREKPPGLSVREPDDPDPVSGIAWPSPSFLENECLWKRIASGGQSHVHASGDWVIKTPRISCFSLLTRLIVPGRWARLDRTAIRPYLLPTRPLLPLALTCDTGKASPRNSILQRQVRHGTLSPRVPRSQWLLRRFFLARNAEPVHLLNAQVETLEKLAAHGWYLVDFIMGNFAWINGRMLLADTDLLVPGGALWQPSLRITAAFFRRHLLADYRRLLLRKMGKARDEGTRTLIAAFLPDFEARMQALPAIAARAWRNR